MKQLLALSLNGTPFAAPTEILSGGLKTTGGSLIKNSIFILIVSAAILSLFVILMAGIQWITSGGDKNKIQAARNRLTFAVIGLVLALLAIFIVSVFGHLFGVDIFKGPVGSES